MEDFRRIETLAAIAKDQQREIQRIRGEAYDFPRHPLNLRRILVTLTVLILGMLAWWGQ